MEIVNDHVQQNKNKVASGSIFHAVWGYSMTLNIYAQVIRVSGSRVYYRILGNESTETTSYLAGREKPISNSFVSEERYAKLKYSSKGLPCFYANPNGLKGDSYKVRFKEWDGSDNYFNHCD